MYRAHPLLLPLSKKARAQPFRPFSCYVIKLCAILLPTFLGTINGPAVSTDCYIQNDEHTFGYLQGHFNGMMNNVILSCPIYFRRKPEENHLNYMALSFRINT